MSDQHEPDRPVRGRQLQELAPDWRVMSMSGEMAWFAAPSHRAGAALVQQIAALAPTTPPDVDLRANGVQIRIPHAVGLFERGVALANAISAAAHRLGLVSDPTVPQELEWSIDTLDKPRLLPFWQTLLGYQDTPDDDLVDPWHRDPRVWFYEAAPRPLRNRIHLDVSVPAEQIGPRVAAVQATGLNGDYAPEQWRVLLVDPEGNEIDFVPGDVPAAPLAAAGWRLPFGGMIFYPVTEAGRAADLAGRVAAVADDIGLPLMIDIRESGVIIDTGKDQWEDPRFEAAAQAVVAIAADLGLTADPSPLRFLQVCIDAVDVPAVRGFWRSVLGYVDDPRPGVTDIYDPRRLNHPMIFQQMEADDGPRREQRNRIHLDLYVPSDQVAARREAALAAGGRLAGPHGTIADPEGNEVDIGTAMAG